MDTISVVELEKPSGMQRGWPQPYEISVIPQPGSTVPALPFLHKGDGITLADGTGYWIESARQVLVEHAGGTLVHWVYRATRDTSNDEESW